MSEPARTIKLLICLVGILSIGLWSVGCGNDDDTGTDGDSDSDTDTDSDSDTDSDMDTDFLDVDTDTDGGYPCAFCHDQALGENHLPLEQFPPNSNQCWHCHHENAAQGSQVLESSHAGWMNPGCLQDGCHAVPSTAPHQSTWVPWVCGQCHGSNGAPEFPWDQKLHPFLP